MHYAFNRTKIRAEIMDPNPFIEGYLKKLSEKIRSAESDCIMDLLPNSREKEKSLLNFLCYSKELFLNSFCFRPAIAKLAITYTNGDYLAIVRKIKKSDMAIIVWLLRTGPAKTGYLAPQTTYKINIWEFNMIKSVGDISNFRNLALENCRLINCQDIFEAQYSKREYG